MFYFRDVDDNVDPRIYPTGPNHNSVLWNAMVHPLLNMTIFGAIWYQGRVTLSNFGQNRTQHW